MHFAVRSSYFRTEKAICIITACHVFLNALRTVMVRLNAYIPYYLHRAYTIIPINPDGRELKLRHVCVIVCSLRLYLRSGRWPRDHHETCSRLYYSCTRLEKFTFGRGGYLANIAVKCEIECAVVFVHMCGMVLLCVLLQYGGKEATCG